jgi:putative SOS response-associated peptidase YedK
MEVFMCGRLNVIDAPIMAFLSDYLVNVPSVASHLNVAPTESVWSLYQLESQWDATPMRWWLVPHWSKGPQSKYSMFNARAETIATRPAYREAFQKRRCIIPVSGYFEWRRVNGQAQPMVFEPIDSELLLLAGLWDRWQGKDETIISCTVVTTAATQTMSGFHHRLPLMLSRGEAEAWMDPRSPQTQLNEIIAPRLRHPLKVTDVTSAMNNARDKSSQSQVAIRAPRVVNPE